MFLVLTLAIISLRLAGSKTSVNPSLRNDAGQIDPPGMDAVVTNVVNNNEITGLVFSTFDMFMHMMEFEKTRVLSGPEFVIPPTDSTSIIIPLVNDFLNFNGNISVVLGCDRILGLQDILAGPETGATGEPGT